MRYFNKTRNLCRIILPKTGFMFICWLEALPDECSGGVDGGVQRGGGAEVDAVEVDAARVGAVVSARDAVRVEEGDHLEDVVLAQLQRHWVVPRQQQAQEAIEHEAGRRLAGVHASRYEDHLFDLFSYHKVAKKASGHLNPLKWRRDRCP